MNTYLLPGILVCLLALLIGWLVCGTALRRYTGLNRGKMALLWLLAAPLLAGMTLCLPGLEPLNHHTLYAPSNPLLVVVSSFVLWLLALCLGVRVYHKWIGGHLTDAEKLPGMTGVRAWLDASGVVCVILISFCAWVVFGVSPLLVFALSIGLLLAYPAFNMASASPPSPAAAAPAEDLSAEREKVLQLLEAGRINADESAELLSALGQSVPPRPQPAGELELSPQRKLVLLGAGLLLLGFFLPWFSINLNTVARDMASQFRQNMGPMFTPPSPALSGTVEVRGGDLAHGLGWWILALGIGAAAVPFFTTRVDPLTQKKAILAALGISAILLVYVLSGSLRFASVGIILALVGLALETLGTLKEQSAPQ